MERHLFEDSVVPGKRRVDNGEVMRIREVEEIDLYFPVGPPIEDPRVHVTWAGIVRVR